jgi:hypothetical protein
MKCAIEMGSGGMLYVPRFIKIGSGIQNLLAGINIQTHSKVISLSMLLFFVNKESRINRGLISMY